MPVRTQVIYRGRVQGVGFRATARACARGFNVGGWVRNQPDGSVLLLAEGPQSEVDGLLYEIRRRMGRLIESEDAGSSPIPASEVSPHFEIRR